MSKPQVLGNRKPVTASSLLDAVADSITAIKSEDRLKWEEIGQVLGRGEDQVARYADGSATMDFIAYAKGKIAWGSRFTGRVDELIGNRVALQEPRAVQTCILAAALALSHSLEDGTLTDNEIREHRSKLEKSKDAIDSLLQRLTVRAA